MMPALLDGRPAHRTSLRRLEAVLGPPLWWACHLGASYWLVPRLCRWSVVWPVHLLTVALLLLIVRALVSGLQLLRAGQAAADAPGAARDVFLGWVGVAFALLFGTVTVAVWLTALFLDPCW